MDRKEMCGRIILFSALPHWGGLCYVWFQSLLKVPFDFLAYFADRCVKFDFLLSNEYF